jgi:hypothetical protein
MAQGTYADIIFSKESNKKLDSIIKSFGLKKDFTDAYHCTLTYSSKPVPFLKTSKGTKQVDGKAEDTISKLIKIKGFGHFDTDEGKNLHVVLECPWCETQFQRAIKSGATTDYPNYTAHVTLMYNCKGFDLDFKKNKDLTKPFIGNTIEIIQERISPLNEDWVEDSLKDDKDNKDNKEKK